MKRDFIEYLEALSPKPVELRLGQHMSNLLAQFNTPLYLYVSKRSNLDPFYLDSNIPAFLSFISVNWNKLKELNITGHILSYNGHITDCIWYDRDDKVYIVYINDNKIESPSLDLLLEKLKQLWKN